MPTPLQAYFQQVRTYLQLDPAVDDEVVRELRAHAEDRIEDLRRQGASEEEAVRVLLHDLDSPRSLARRFQEAHARVGWHDALLAGLPFLLVSALLATHLWRQPVVAFALAVSVVGMTFGGLRQRRPPWFYAWAGLALTLLIFCGYFAFRMADLGVAFIQGDRLDVLSGFGLAGSSVYFPLGLLVLLSSVVAASRRDWLDASLMIAPSAPVVVWLAALHQGGEGQALTRFDPTLALVFLAMAPAATVFVRAPLRAVKLAILLASAGAVLAGVTVASSGAVSLPLLAGETLALFGLLLLPAAIDFVANARWPTPIDRLS